MNDKYNNIDYNINYSYMINDNIIIEKNHHNTNTNNNKLLLLL